MPPPRELLRSRFTSRSISAQALLGGYAGSILAIKTTAESLPLEEILSLVLLGLASREQINIDLFLFILNLSLLFVTIVVLSPARVPDNMPSARSFSILFSIVTITYPAIILSGTSPTGRASAGILLGVFFLSILLYWIYFRVRPTDWQQFAIRFWDQVVTIVQPADKSPPETVSEQHTVILLAAAFTAIVSLGLGVTATALLFLSPALEVLVLFWVSVSVLSTATDRAPSLSRTPPTETLNQRLFTLTDHIGTPKANYTILVVVAGVIQSSVATVTAGTITQTYILPTLSQSTDFLTAWAYIGDSVGLLSISAYALLFWSRTIERLPAYFAQWRQAESGAEITATRPMGLMTPLVLVSLPIGLHLRGNELSLPVYAVIWPVSVSLLWVAVLLAKRRTPYDASREEIVLPLVFLVQTASTLIAIPFEISNVELFVAVGCLVLGLFYAPTVANRLKRTTLLRRITALLLYHGLFAVVFVFLGFEGSAQKRLIYRLLASGFALILLTHLVKVRFPSR